MEVLSAVVAVVRVCTRVEWAVEHRDSAIAPAEDLGTDYAVQEVEDNLSTEDQVGPLRLRDYCQQTDKDYSRDY